MDHDICLQTQASSLFTGNFHSVGDSYMSELCA